MPWAMGPKQGAVAKLNCAMRQGFVPNSHAKAVWELVPGAVWGLYVLKLPLKQFKMVLRSHSTKFKIQLTILKLTQRK